MEGVTGKYHSIQTSKKTPQEVLFTRKNSNITHPIIYFNNVQVQRAHQQKHSGIILEEKLNFKCHIDKFLTKANRGIAFIKRFRYFLPRKSLITIYKAITRPHPGYGDILYNQSNNAAFCQTFEFIQYKAALAITGAIQGASTEKVLDELDIETLKSQEWLRRLCCMSKFINVCQWCIHRLPDAGIPVCAPKPCAQIKRKTNANQHKLLNHSFNANASAPSQTFNLSNALKIVELTTLCFPVPATLVCLNVSQGIVCINKSSLYIVPVCPNLPLDTTLLVYPTPYRSYY